MEFWRPSFERKVFVIGSASSGLKPEELKCSPGVENAAGVNSATPRRACAGAFLMDEGYGQFIAGIGFSEGSRRFDSGGTAQPTPAYRKAIASGYLEYGWRSWLTLVAAPTLARANGVAANQVTGSDDSAFGARILLFGQPGRVVSLQVLVQPPLGGDRASRLANGGAGAFATDLRLQFGQGFALWAWPAFVDIAPGVRLRADPLPSEARLDLAFGLRPVPRLLLLLQDFSSLAPSRGAAVPRTSYSKLQGSLVYDLGRRWSAQVGAFRTIAGRNAVRETGPLAALWMRF